VEIGGVAHFSSHWHTTSSGVFGGHFPHSPEASYAHCKEVALLIKHLPNTGSHTRPAAVARVSPSPEEPAVSLAMPRPSQAFLPAASGRWAHL